MVDIHCHIIPGVDDGSKNLEETFQMLKEAEEAGFTDIITTSHFLDGYYNTDPNELIFWNDKIQEILISQERKARVYPGMEIYLSSDIDKFIKKSKLLNLANSRYILIEFPMNAEPMCINEVMYCVQAFSLIPIIAHPERYNYIQDNPKKIKEYIELGCKLQCNYGSILGTYGKDAQTTVKYLLKNDLVDFLGSDCHKPNTIYKTIPEACKKIKKIVGEKRFEEISTLNPIKILENEEIE